MEPSHQQIAMQTAWTDLKHQNGLELVICIGAATRRGLIDENNPTDTKNIHPTFEVVGLGQLIDAIVKSDRFITFAE